MLKSLKQLLRTPVKAVLFFLLMTAATALLVLGANLWAQTQAQMDAVEKQFTTLGTVEQKPNRTQMRTGWDAADGAYYSEAEPVYDSVISADVLDFDGANYLKAPEKRPYYLADLQGLAVRNGGTALFYPVVEFTPAETAVPDHPIKVYVQRFLYPEAENQNNEYEIYVCDHWTENPAPLEAGKTYVAYTNVIVNHHENAKSSIEYALIAAERSTQCDAGGNLLESDMQTRTFDEVTAGFYETERGQYWLELSKALSMWDTTAPVLPVTDTALLPSFHDRTVYVREGRTFSAEDLENGAAVCLVSEEFARKNGLSIGDKVELPLYGVNEKDSPHRTFGDGSGLRTFSLLNAQNRAYTSFWTAKYEIIGTYYSVGTYGKPAGSIEMALNLFLIPANSVKADFAGNIVDSGPMQRATTSFQIPNGTIDDYMAAYNRNVPAEVRENLEITFDDNGYSQIIGGLLNMRYVAIILFAAGLLSALAILVLLLYFFIVKQKKRTAIERSLGMSKAQCRVSLMAGILVLALVASVIGVGIGAVLLQSDVLTGTAQSETEEIDTTFSIWAKGQTEVTEPETDATVPVAVYVFIPVCLLVFIFLLSLVLVNRNLKTEPILLLSGKGE
ncbi:ABC transporter permease [Hominenteromicrobium sp.]|uniref:ABC transporter permease n=2 Tax=Hominenteromicrobium sp. TaxID=3073581 RepID=UPI003AEF1A49